MRTDCTSIYSQGCELSDDPGNKAHGHPHLPLFQLLFPSQEDLQDGDDEGQGLPAAGDLRREGVWVGLSSRLIVGGEQEDRLRCRGTHRFRRDVFVLQEQRDGGGLERGAVRRWLERPRPRRWGQSPRRHPEGPFRGTMATVSTQMWAGLESEDWFRRPLVLGDQRVCRHGVVRSAPGSENKDCTHFTHRMSPPGAPRSRPSGSTS